MVDPEFLSDVIAMAIHAATKDDHVRVQSLEQRVDALEATNTALQKSVDLLALKPSVQDASVWRPDTSYAPGDIVSRHGAAWIYSGVHRSSHDLDHTKFRLFVKAGKDARTNGRTREA